MGFFSSLIGDIKNLPKTVQASVSRAEWITAELKVTKDRIYDLGVKLKDIDNKSGEAVLAAVATMGLNAVGIPIVLPKELGYWAFGAFGALFAIVKQKKIKPIAKELTELEKKYNDLVTEYQAIIQTEEYKTAVANTQAAQATATVAQAAAKNATGATTATNSTSNTNLLWGGLILAFLIGIYFYFRRSNAVYY